MEVVQEQSESRTAVLWKHRSTVSWHQEADLQTNREKRVVTSVFTSKMKKKKKTKNERVQMVTLAQHWPVHLQGPNAAHSMAYRSLAHCSLFKEGETRCCRNRGLRLYRPLTSPHNRPCRRQQNKAFKSINNSDNYVHLPSSHRLRDLYNCVGWTLARLREKAFAESQQGSV